MKKSLWRDEVDKEVGVGEWGVRGGGGGGGVGGEVG